VTPPDVFPSRAPRLAARKVGDEMVILKADDSSLFVLNAVGTAVWQAADGRTPLRVIVDDIICREYAVDRDTAQRDLDEFVEALLAAGVLQISHQPIGADEFSDPVGPGVA
jgi:hypothetical protein